jgi:hypothetical protein
VLFTISLHWITFFVVFLSSICASVTEPALKIHSPGEGLVFQRDGSGAAIVRVSGTCSREAQGMEARVLAVDGESKSTPWTLIDAAPSHGSFAGDLPVKGGWYRLEIRELPNQKGAESLTAVERLGVGEVFIVVGHSVAQGGAINLAGATDERARTIALSAEETGLLKQYERTADPTFLPALVGSPFSDGVKPAPFGHGTYFWAKFAEAMVKRHRVPVLVLNAAFGGTSLEYWAKSSRGEMFEHSFVNASIGMPYANLRNSFSHYTSRLGLRALLADHGQNDWTQENEELIVANYRAWIEQARRDLGFEQLAVVVNRQSFGEKKQVRRSQERTIVEVPHCFAGPDYDTLATEDREDGIHLSPSGAKKAAEMWASSVDVEFLASAKPFLPSNQK